MLMLKNSNVVCIAVRKYLHGKYLEGKRYINQDKTGKRVRT